MRTKRLSLIAASLVLVGGMTAACGDNGDDEKAGESTNTPAEGNSSDSPEEPTDEPTDEPDEPTDEPDDLTEEPGDGTAVDTFCQNAIKAGQAEMSDDFESAKTEWAKFYAAGAPSDISDEAAEGFKWYHDLITGPGTQQELQQKYAADTEGQEVFAAFKAYVDTTCAEYAG